MCFGLILLINQRNHERMAAEVVTGNNKEEIMEDGLKEESDKIWKKVEQVKLKTSTLDTRLQMIR